MCGIVGMLSPWKNGFQTDEMDTFKDMLFIDTLRGWDSTGVFSVTNNKNVHIVKGAMHGADFIRSSDFSSWKQSTFLNGLFMVGHNRAATKGSVSDENAHPFWIDDKIVLVQNGTYYGDHSHLKDTEVDTEAVAHVIAEHDDIAEALQKINAAYVLVWYNVDTGCLHIIRNDQRPLYLAYTSTNGIIFASEESTIMYAAYRNKLKLKSPPKMLATSTLYTYRINSRNTWEEEEEEIDAKFRHSNTKTYESTPIKEWDWDEWTSMRYGPNAPGHQSTHKDPIVDKRDNSQITIYDIIQKGDAKDFALTQKQKLYWSNHITENRAGTLPIEFHDYVALNDEKDCRRWMVIGKIISPYEDGEMGSPLVYGFIFDQDEMYMLEYVDHALYTGRSPTAGIIHNVNWGHHDHYQVYTVFVTDLVPIQLVDHVAQ
jgi:hypothetical protein